MDDPLEETASHWDGLDISLENESDAAGDGEDGLNSLALKQRNYRISLSCAGNCCLQDGKYWWRNNWWWWLQWNCQANCTGRRESREKFLFVSNKATPKNVERAT